MIKLVQHLLALPVQEISLIAPQDMALCSLWNDVAATKARTEVWDKFQVRVEDNESAEMQENGVAKGRYDAHINLYGDASFLESESIPEGRHLVTPGHGDEEVTYACKAGVITKLK